MSTPQPLGGASVKYSQQYRRCGKAGCPSCRPPGRGHGPYWYAYWWEGGRVRSRYLGKEWSSVETVLQVMPVVASSRTLQVRTLGSFAVWRSGELVPAALWGRRKAAALFKCLLSAPGYRLHREQVIDLLMPEVEFDKAAKGLRSAVYRLRKVLDSPGAAASHLQSQGDLLVLAPVVDGEPDAGWLDAAAFAREAATALAGQDLTRCHAALSLYGGEYLPEDRYDEWVERRRGELRDQHLALLLHLAHLSQAAGSTDEALVCFRTVLTADRCHEDAARQLMQLLAAEGRRSEALEVYRSLAAALERELGESPAGETQAVRARLLAEAPVTLMPPAPRTNLRAPLTSFVGREWERTEVSRLLRDGTGGCRLVTLVGAGGCGKTRLALEVGRGLLEDYPDGVFLADLATVSDSERLAEAVADALGVREQVQRVEGQAALEVLSSHLAPKRLLLVLDNCEHLVAGCAQLATVLLQRAAELRILATSQATLGVLGEIIWRVPSLSLPDADEPPVAELVAYEAIQLFLERARAAKPHFSFSERNAAAVLHICSQLDGIPLAIELAAARLSVLSVEQIAARLGDRLRLLSDGNRTALPRQQTLRAAIEWSYNLLTAGERVLFRRLAVFAGSWTMEAAEAVCAGESLSRHAVVERMSGVIGKSMVNVVEAGESVRYRLLESVRHYALEQLCAADEEDAVRERHCDWYLALAERAEPELKGPEQAEWLAQLELEHDNLRAALGWAGEHGAVETGLRLAGALWRFWYVRGYLGEGRRWLEAASGSGLGSHAARAKALNGAGNLAWQQGDFDRATDLHEWALELHRAAQDKNGVAGTLGSLGTVAFGQGDYSRADALYEECLALKRDLGDRWGIAAALNNLAMVAYQRGNYDRASTLYEEGLALQRELQDRKGVAGSLGNLGLVVFRQGDYGRAVALQEEALKLERELGGTLGAAITLGHLGAAVCRQGDYVRAAALHEESLAFLRELGDRQSIALSLGNLGEVAYMEGDIGRATSLYEEGLALQRRLGDKHGSARSLTNLGIVSFMQGDYDRAAALFDECLVLSRDLDARDQQAEGLEGMAWVAAAQGHAHLGALLGGAAETLRTALGVPLTPVQHGGHERALQLIRRALSEVAFSAAWTEGMSMTQEAAVALALESGIH
ncbi:MAG: transcriptional activator domain protein [Chloroflexi bacterium]|nr:transcriptional activator domain protein [Chloroflexota bacterium]